MGHHLTWCHVSKALKDVKASQGKEPGAYLGKMCFRHWEEQFKKLGRSQRCSEQQEDRRGILQMVGREQDMWCEKHQGPSCRHEQVLRVWCALWQHYHRLPQTSRPSPTARQKMNPRRGKGESSRVMGATRWRCGMVSPECYQQRCGGMFTQGILNCASVGFPDLVNASTRREELKMTKVWLLEQLS